MWYMYNINVYNTNNTNKVDILNILKNILIITTIDIV